MTRRKITQTEEPVIPKTITNRIPKTKDCEDPTWFEGEKYQCLPKHGYTKMMEKMLQGLDVVLGCDKNEWKNHDSDLIIYTGKIDEFYDYEFGELPYRTLEFKHHFTSQKLDHPIINQNNLDVLYILLNSSTSKSFPRSTRPLSV